MVGKAQKLPGVSSKLYGICSNEISLILLSASIATSQSHNADALNKVALPSKKGSFKMTITPFLRSGWSTVRSSLLAKGGTSKSSNLE
jgi:hypothetical protein